MGSKGVALLVAVIGVIALAAAGIYLYRHHGPAPGVEDKVATGEKPGAEQPKPESRNRPRRRPQSPPPCQASTSSASSRPAKASLPAAPSQAGPSPLESGGDKIAETQADEEGAWSIVLDKPLARRGSFAHAARDIA